MPSSLKLAALSAFVAAAQAFVDPIAISSPQKVPTGASWNVPHDFASFSFPAHWFADFAGMYLYFCRGTYSKAKLCSEKLTNFIKAI